MIRIYLDNCCYNRPFDDQNQIQVRLESDSKLYIQELVRSSKLELVWSFVLDYENGINPYPDKKDRIQIWRNFATTHCIFSPQLAEKAQALMTLGLKQVDAAHIACAIVAEADYFITTDRKIINKRISDISIVSPTIFLAEMEL